MAAKKNRKFDVLRRLYVILIVVLPIILWFIMIYKWDSTYSITAITERFKYITKDDNTSKLVLYNTKMYNDDQERIDTLSQWKVDTTLNNKKGFSGSFKMGIQSTATIERIANGNLSIQIKGNNEEFAGTFFTEQDDVFRKSENFVEFYIDDIDQRIENGKTIIVPINGEDVEIGRSVNYDSYSSSTGIVKNGQVTIISYGSFSNKMFKSNAFDLNIGDQFHVAKPSSRAYGFAVINENSAMSLSYKISGVKGTITTPGPLNDNMGYVIKPSVLSLFSNDAFIKSVTIAFTILVGIANILPVFKRDLELLGNSKKKTSKKKTSKKSKTSKKQDK